MLVKNRLMMRSFSSVSCSFFALDGLSDMNLQVMIAPQNNFQLELAPYPMTTPQSHQYIL